MDCGDAAVVPVRPRVGREQERRPEGRQLDGDGEREDDPRTRLAPAEGRQPAEVRRERTDGAGEEGPRPAPVTDRMPRVARDQGRAPGPCQRPAGGDERERREARPGRREATGSESCQAGSAAGAPASSA